MLELVHIARRRGDSEHLPLELMFDMLQDEVADLRSENASLKADISRLNQRVTFLFSFFYLQEVNTIATTQAAGKSSSVSILLGGTSAPHTTGTKTFADVITDSIVTRTGQSLTINSSTVGGPLTTDVVYKPTTLLDKTIQGAVLSAVHGEMLSKEACRRNIIVRGLPPKNGTSDIVLIDDLIEVENWFRPKTSRTRRLGRSSTTASSLSPSPSSTSLTPPTCWSTPCNCVSPSTTTSVERHFATVTLPKRKHRSPTNCAFNDVDANRQGLGATVTDHQPRTID